MTAGLAIAGVVFVAASLWLALYAARGQGAARERERQAARNAQAQVDLNASARKAEDMRRETDRGTYDRAVDDL